jgi:hypothetical protein
MGNLTEIRKQIEALKHDTSQTIGSHDGFEACKSRVLEIIDQALTDGDIPVAQVVVQSGGGNVCIQTTPGNSIIIDGKEYGRESE